MSSLFSSFGYNFSGQLIARMISFLINMYLLRHIRDDVLGLVNVSLTLLYSTILFLTREPMRKANILRDSIPKFVNILWLSPLIALANSVIFVFIWNTFSSTRDQSWFVLLAFPLSAVIEALAEPFAVVSLRFSLGGHFAVGQGVLICVKRVFVLAGLFLFPKVNHLDLFVYAQYLGTISYLLFHVIAFYIYMKNKSKPELEKFGSFNDFLPNPSEGIDRESLEAVGTMLSHSVLKQAITEGSGFVMTFTNLLSLKDQAVYDAVEKIGSLVARTILAPLEENCYAFFANIIQKESTVFQRNSDNHDQLINNLSTLLHVVGVIGFVACVFGVPFSPIAISWYGGDLLEKNGGSTLLSLYTLYIFVMAVNGITECFAMASMNNKEVFSHGKFLFFTAATHLAINYVLCLNFNSAGFIAANVITMSFRIVYSWRHIQTYLGARCPSFFTVLPNSSTCVFLVACFFGTGFSYFIFATTPGFMHKLAHIAIGAILFFFLSLSILQEDHVFQGIMNKFVRAHQD